MPGLIGNGVSLHGIYHEDYAYTWNISGVVDKSADIGKAMSQDKTADDTAKLAADGDTLIGALGSYEDRVQEGIKVGTVYHKGNFQFPYTGALAVGDSVIGAGAGQVKTAGVGVSNNTLVTKVDATNSLATVVFL